MLLILLVHPELDVHNSLNILLVEVVRPSAGLGRDHLCMVDLRFVLFESGGMVLTEQEVDGLERKPFCLGVEKVDGREEGRVDDCKDLVLAWNLSSPARSHSRCRISTRCS